MKSWSDPMNTPMELVRIACERLEAQCFHTIRTVFPDLSPDEIEDYLSGRKELDEVLPLPAM